MVIFTPQLAIVLAAMSVSGVTGAVVPQRDEHTIAQVQMAVNLDEGALLRRSSGEAQTLPLPAKMLAKMGAQAAATTTTTTTTKPRSAEEHGKGRHGKKGKGKKHHGRRALSVTSNDVANLKVCSNPVRCDG